MRAVIQRISRAAVTVEGKVVGRIGKGLLVYISVGKNDSEKDVRFLAERVVNLRIFEDSVGKMNINVKEAGGEILAVSNFTLHGDCRKGRRPGFDEAAKPELAQDLYEKVVTAIAEHGVSVEEGVFGTHMEVESVNDGPVTFFLDSK